MKIILCDDDINTLDTMEQMINDVIIKNRFNAEIVCRALKPEEVMLFLDKNPQNYLFFLDLDMGERRINGLDLARELKRRIKESKIVFVTSHIEKSLDILKSGVEPFGFVEKSIHKKMMEKDLEKYIRLFLKDLTSGEIETKKTIPLQIGIDEILEIAVDRIAYVEAVKHIAHNICYHTIDGSTIVIRDTLAHAKEQLGDDFEICHRSVLVNVNYVVGTEDGMLKLSNGELVACAISKWKLFKRQI